MKGNQRRIQTSVRHLRQSVFRKQPSQMTDKIQNTTLEICRPDNTYQAAMNVRGSSKRNKKKDFWSQIPTC